MRVLLLLLFFSCQNEKEIISIELSNDIVPIPKEVTFNDKDKGLAFSKNIFVSYENPTETMLTNVIGMIASSYISHFKFWMLIRTLSRFA